MNKFNLTFWGEILPGRDPETVKARFAKMFDIREPEQLERFFSGETIVLRRNIERKVAAEYYAKLRKLGVEAELRKIDATGIATETETQRAHQEQAEKEKLAKRAKWEQARQEAEQEAQLRATKERERKLESSRQRQQRERREAQESEWKARQLEREREQLAQAARRQKEREKQAILRTEEERRRQEQAEARAQKDAEETARRRAEAEATAQRKAEEVQRKQAEAEERARLKAEESARKKAAREAARKTKAEAEAKRKAEAAERRAQEESQRRQEKADREAKAARQRAEREAQKKNEQELAAKKKAEREAAERERARQLALQREKDAAELRLRQEAEAEAAAKAAEIKRQEQERIERKRAEESARRQREAAARRAAQEAERVAREAEKARLKEEQEAHKARELALEQEREAERKRLEEQALARGAAELSTQKGLKVKSAAVRSAMELPRREKLGSGPSRKRQSGAPNDYRTHPFRNSAEVRSRATVARDSLKRTLAIAATILAATLLLTGRYISLDPTETVSGPSRIVAAPTGTLLVEAAGQLLIHDRSGTGKNTLSFLDLGLAADTRSLGFGPDGKLLVWGSAIETKTASEDTTGAGLWSCDLATEKCKALPKGVLASAPDNVVIHDLSGQMFVATAGTGELLKLDPTGEILSRTERAFAPSPALRLEMGLLFAGSAEGPAVSVLRYEDDAFGRQLDEVLLLPPRALEESQTQVHDFIRSGEYWWVSLRNPETASGGLYLFDSDWKYLRELAVPATLTSGHLTRWGQKILLFHPGTTEVLRFSSTGLAEVNYESDLLTEFIAEQHRSETISGAIWATVFSLCLVAVVGALTYTCHQYLRSLVYVNRPASGAEPLDQYSEHIVWVDPVEDRRRDLLRTGLGYGLICIAVLLLIAGLDASAHQALAAILALSGPAIGLLLYGRGESGHAGRVEDTLALVDHRDMYHLAHGARIHYRGPFLMIDDVVVFTGTALVPNLNPEQVRELIYPLARHGARVDRKTALIKLLEVRHPLAVGGVACAVSLLAALVVLVAGSF
ncbi:hypothetical protein EY643_06360 [Halioglobus maricola]|uniref:Uncharacterized protein n=1 Tax=Halioglobus maricola TaxID=2601894 RepID=A0A5P9NJA2_9GAMM|nr:hypothetical protein [Halioglobus maricola]QFU75304.1 hypothetical protein EY643_06360 [Halioglobus maricola]